MSETPTDVEETSRAEAFSKLDTVPEVPDELGTRQRAPRSTGGSILYWLRWAWYLLTSMRTALILLFFLALGAVPGSVFPQLGGTDAIKVGQFYRAHPTIAPLLGHLGFFNVFGSEWFAAIYLLLFISLAGCVLPRSRRHFAMMRARPPAAPRNVSRLPLSATWLTATDADNALGHAHQLLRSKHFRVDRAAASVNAEKGYLRETGNLLFHLSLLVVLVGIAFTSVFGYSGTALVKEHQGFTDTLIDYDSFSHGRFVNVTQLPPFSFTLNSFDATYQHGGSANGDASSFDAHVTWQPNLTAATRSTQVSVNHPLTTQGTSIYLTGHGYSPHFVVRDGSGRTYDEITPFLPQQGTFEYHGVVKLPDTKPSQLAISGFFLPTLSFNPTTAAPISIFPAADNPAVVIGVYSGNLGLDTGVPQSVYTLDTSKLKLLTSVVMMPGDTITLPDGDGTVTFAGYEQWAAFQINHDPGKKIVLAAVSAMVLGLLFSLRVRRRRLWVRASRDSSGRTLVEVGGLTRTDASGGFDEEFARLVKALRSSIAPLATEQHQTEQHEEV
jgi:cytochrome c biogenesis protein